MYRAVSVVALPLASLYLMWRSRRQPAYRQFWDERFAWSSFPLKTGRPRVWIHAVSVGETNAAKPLLEAVLERWPECDVLLTHMTPTGREAGAKLVALAPDRIHQCYLPYDAPYAVEKFFRQTQPTIGIIMETEVWPNLMSEAKRCGVPMVLANARESEKSRAQAEKFLDVMGPAFGSFTAILAQSEEDKERLESLGGRNVTVCGSVKFDIRPNASQEAAARAWKASLSRPVALIASTRQGEEVLFAKAMATRPELLRRAQFWLVPRHPQRFDEVFRTLTGAGLPPLADCGARRRARRHRRRARRQHGRNELLLRSGRHDGHGRILSEPRLPERDRARACRLAHRRGTVHLQLSEGHPRRPVRRRHGAGRDSRGGTRPVRALA